MRQMEYAFLREGSHPLVTVVIPAWQEEGAITHALDSIRAQSYPIDRIELVVVVGASRDRTHALALEAARSDRRISVIHNPDPRTPVSLNLGIRRSQGSIIARVDAHGWVDPDYLANGVEALRRTRADAVGGVVSFHGSGRIGRSIALAMGSRLGAGTAAFRSATRETRADGLMWGMYPRELFSRLGMFDEQLLRNQDDDFCFRIEASGGVMVVTPAMRFSQHARSSLRSLWSQYQQWGAYRFATLRKHGRPATVRQVIPPALTLALSASVAGSLTRGKQGWIARVPSVAYAAIAGAAGLRLATRAGDPELAPTTAAAIATMQIAYGVGFWQAAASGAKSPLARRLQASLST